MLLEALILHFFGFLGKVPEKAKISNFGHLGFLISFKNVTIELCTEYVKMFI